MNLSMRILKVSLLTLVLSLFATESFAGLCKCTFKAGGSSETSDHMTNPSRCETYKTELTKNNPKGIQTCVFSAKSECGSRNNNLSTEAFANDVVKAKKDIDSTLCKQNRGQSSQIIFHKEAKKLFWLCTDGTSASTVDCSAPIK